jgi:hypothetical protein
VLVKVFPALEIDDKSEVGVQVLLDDHC